ncbi:hypothetical protein BDV96DRAFT_244754 [Lophiotrema nucula]|uniref:Uncharacterized protein n=1 Tax=Lophiotrema nucula TaxID=690887 RepID=A0A6A5YQ93_9PLEO|nr:hypothetical protein BDV96DRAFT_244754 [Lophiotrema nucula]
MPYAGLQPTEVLGRVLPALGCLSTKFPIHMPRAFVSHLPNGFCGAHRRVWCWTFRQQPKLSHACNCNQKFIQVCPSTVLSCPARALFHISRPRTNLPRRSEDAVSFQPLFGPFTRQTALVLDWSTQESFICSNKPFADFYPPVSCSLKPIPTIPKPSYKEAKDFVQDFVIARSGILHSPVVLAILSRPIGGLVNSCSAFERASLREAPSSTITSRQSFQLCSWMQLARGPIFDFPYSLLFSVPAGSAISVSRLSIPRELLTRDLP